MDAQAEILVKGMVCERCKVAIKEGILNLGYTVKNVSLGKISLTQPLEAKAMGEINALLNDLGFDIISSRYARVVARVKQIISDAFRDNVKHEVRQKLSLILSQDLNMNYDSISELFTKYEGVTIEKYVISKRLEKVKELLVYSDFTLTEVAHIAGFNSINHLSRQFKELVGLSPSHFKALRKEKKSLSGENANII